jgi:hypothetical protein
VLWLDGHQNRHIQNLQGLQFLHNLTWLDLSSNRISDLYPLSELTELAVLNLSANHITDISPLAGLSNLSTLSLGQQYGVGGANNLVPWGSSLSIPATQIQDENGNRIPILISNNGTYHDGMVTWTELPPIQTSERQTLFVSYEWSQFVQIGNASTWFAGSRNIRFLPFHDVIQDDWFSCYVWAAVHNGWVVGTSETTFSPYAPLTRAEAATIFHRIAGEPAVTFQPVFDDVIADQWHSTAITWAHHVGLVKGIGDGRFAPEQLITGEQLATMLLRSIPVFALREATIPENAVVPEFEASAWAYEAMRVATFYGLIVAENPASPTSRAEAVAFIVRFIDEFFIG